MTQNEDIDGGIRQGELADPVMGDTRARWPEGASGAGRRARRWIAANFEEELEAGRGFLWLPVAFAAGILIYFELPEEPWLPVLAASAALLIAAASQSRGNALAFRLFVFGAAVFSGLVTAKVRTDLAASPVLARPMTVEATGWIARTEQTAAGGKRILLHVADLAEHDPEETPVRIRVTIRSNADALQVGDAVAVLANLGPPSGPVLPGGYDFSFFPFYERIGGVGFAYGAAKPVELGPAPWPIRLRAPIEHLRDKIRRKIEAALPGDYGHIAAALVMGDQRGIAEATHEDMRASGLGHILSISGLHMALVAGSVFWVLRAVLAMFPVLALNYPIKKWAAVGALVAATFYLGISGAEVATVRSYVMLAIMLIAILLDRRALTLRNVALAALLILVFSPESLLSISFQMSFAATIALIATYEGLSVRAENRETLTDARDQGFMGRWGAVVLTLFLTSLVAGIATAPFGAFYFQRVAPLTIVANMAVAPAVTFIVMPMALVTVVVMPLGLEAWPLAVMHLGLWWMVTVAEATASWSEGWGGVRALPPVSLLLFAAGLLWLALWRQRWRLLGIVPMAIALSLAFMSPRPVLLVDESASAVAIRAEDGRLAILGGRGAAFEVENWLRADGDVRTTSSPDLGVGTACDALGCVGTGAGVGVVALVNRAEAFAEDCRAADVVVSRWTAPQGCSLHAHVIDRERLDRFGAHAIYVRDGTLEVSTAYPEVRRPFMPPVRE
jgi:competence protein ComEC